MFTLDHCGSDEEDGFERQRLLRRCLPDAAPSDSTAPEALMVLSMVLSLALRTPASATGNAGGSEGLSSRLPLTSSSCLVSGADPIIHSSCEGELGVALESLQGKGDLT